MKQRYGRPHLFGEFGVPRTAEVLAGMAQVDPQGIHLLSTHQVARLACCGGVQ